MQKSIETFLAALDADSRATVDALRSVVSGSHPEVAEHIKWNAPSFAIDGDDRITLGLERKGGVRVVLHRGAKPKDMAGFRFDDPLRLLKWAAPDRGVAVFRTAADVKSRSDALADLCRRWIDYTR